MRANAGVIIPPGICGECGAEFTRNLHRRKYCSVECADTYNSRNVRLRLKEKYWSDPAAASVRQKAAYAALSIEERRARLAYQYKTCIICGSAKRRQDITEEGRSTFVCQDCHVVQRRANWPIVNCYFCGKEIHRSPTLLRAHMYCTSCTGSLARAGVALSLSRERIRQLVNRAVSVAAVGGAPITRKEALAQVVEERSGGG